MSNRHFSPLELRNVLLAPLKNFFEVYAPDTLKYSSKVEETKIEIGTVNDFHKVRIEQLPRIMIERGPIEISARHLNEDLSEATPLNQTGGKFDHVNHTFIAGTVNIMLEARQEGVVEMMADLVATMLSWTRNLIARESGLKSLAPNISVGSCAPFDDGESDTSFRCVIQFQYTVEESWRISEDAIKLKDLKTTVNYQV